MDTSVQPNIQRNVMSLFSGCGGMDLGFEGDFTVHKHSVNPKFHPAWLKDCCQGDWLTLPKTNFKTVFANDIRPGARSAWNNFFKDRYTLNDNQTFHLGSIVDYVKDIDNPDNPLLKHNIDVVTGGFPCQDFSVAGKRQGFKSNKSHKGRALFDDLEEIDDPSLENRGMLYMWMRKVIEITRPKIFIAENVKGLVSLSNVKSIIENDFRTIGENGYLVIPAQVLKAPEYGIAQSRERVFFIGFLKSALKPEAIAALSKEVIAPEYNPYPRSTHYANQQSQTHLFTQDLLPPPQVAKVLLDLKEPEESKDLSQQKYSKAKWYGKHCQGQTEVNLNSVAPTIRSEHHGNIEYRRLSSEHGGKYIEELQAGLPERRLTVRECARIQTFPDNYEFVSKEVSASEAYKLIGNAVPPFLAYHLATRLEELWDKLFQPSS